MRLEKPIDGTCCSCGYSGADETPCLKREDGTHCEHWCDGPSLVTAVELARILFNDDLSRALYASIEPNGFAAYDDWVLAARQTGDDKTLADLLVVGREAFAAEWERWVKQL